MNDTVNEISLKNLILWLREWIKYLLSKWLVIGIVVILGMAAGIFFAYSSKPRYTASVSFVLSTNSGSGGIMGLATQFGLDFSTDNNDAFTGDNIIALMKSRRMVQEALLKKPSGGESLLNTIIKETELDESWAESARTKDAYPFPDDTSKMTMVQDSLFREVYILVQEKMLDVSKPDKNQSIYAVTTTTTSEIFSYFLTKYLVDVTSKFYIATKTSTAKQNLVMLQKEADSLRTILGGAITSAASQTDLTFNLNPAYQVQRSGAQQSQARASVLGVAYGEVIKNLELAKITLQKETPLYQIIDEPTLPLKMEKRSKIIFGILGGMLGGLMIVGLLIARKTYQYYFQ